MGYLQRQAKDLSCASDFNGDSALLCAEIISNYEVVQPVIIHRDSMKVSEGGYAPSLLALLP